jgi:hypothetical protein
MDEAIVVSLPDHHIGLSTFSRGLVFPGNALKCGQGLILTVLDLVQVPGRRGDRPVPQAVLDRLQRTLTVPDP